MNEIEKIKQAEDRLNKLKSQQSQMLGKKEALLERLAKEFSVETIEEAEKKLEQMQKELSQVDADIQEIIAELEVICNALNCG